MRVLNAKLLATLAAGVLLNWNASATVVTYDFTTDGGNGYFSYDDSNTTTVSGPPGFDVGGVWYNALSFVFGGTSYSGVVGNYDNYGGYSDCLAVADSATGKPGMALCGASSLWSGTSLSLLNGHSTSDFIENSSVRDARGTLVQFLTLVERPASVPEPGTLALLGLGLAGLAASRRRKQ